MDVQDGFILGIYNYCDKWCERCRFTSHCRVFADGAEIEASHDPNLKAVADAPPLPEETPPPPPQWMQELIEELNEASRNPPSEEEWKRIRPRVPAEHKPIDARARRYRERTFQWFGATETTSSTVPQDARDVIAWFHTLIAAKVHRALTKSPDIDVEDDEFDNDGSAKVALLGIDESHAAWIELVERGAVTASDADGFIADLVWLGEALERARPKARAFIRPAFDEPEDVAQFLRREGHR
jgi:hypothetical protein